MLINFIYKTLASATGSVISLSPVFGNFSRIMSRHCQITIAASPGWDFVSEIDSYCIAELQLWLSSIKKVQFKELLSPFIPQPDSLSDASGFACSAISLNNNTQICFKFYS